MNEPAPYAEDRIRAAILAVLRSAEQPLSDRELAQRTGNRHDWIREVLDIMTFDGEVDVSYQPIAAGDLPDMQPGEEIDLPAFTMIVKLPA